MVHTTTSPEDFKSKISKGVAAVDFFATWCGPCKVIAPTFVKFSEQYTDVEFLKVDVDEYPELAQEYGVRAMPTFLVFKDGKEVGKVVGADAASLEKAIKANI